MMKQTIRILIINLLVIMLISCEKDKEETNETIPEVSKPEENTPPKINSQSFEVEEDASQGTYIGEILAQDDESDPLTFSIPNIEGLILDSNSGELTTAKNADFLDYETNEEFEFEVTVSDGKSSSKTQITLLIIDTDDGPLTNFEKNIVAGFKFQIFSNLTDFPLNKRTNTAKIYYSGLVTSSLRSTASNSIKDFNEMFTDGFKIEVVADSLSANVQLFSSTIEDLNNKWPDFGEVAKENPGLGGIAEIGGGRIWIADYAQNNATMKHEMGHMIGLLHARADHCDGEPELNSIMCGGVNAAGEDFTELDRRIIQYYYHPEIINSSGSNETLEKLSELILADRGN